VKVKRVIGFILGFLVIAGSILSVYILAASKTPEQNRAWKYDFGFTMGQDFFFTPLIYILAQYGLHKYVFSSKGQKPGRVKEAVKKRCLDKNFTKVLNGEPLKKEPSNQTELR